MPEISTYLSLLERLQGRNLAANPHQCVTVRNKNVSCLRCARSCPSGCISVCDNELRIDASKCIGCQTCASACPTDAIAARCPTDQEVARMAASALAASGEARTVTFCCTPLLDKARKAIEPDQVVGLACLGRIEESLLLLLATAGAKHVRLVHDDCEACPYAAAGALAEETCACANTLAATWHTPTRFETSRTFPRHCRRDGKPAYDGRKRDFFLGVKNNAEASAGEAMELVIERAFERGREKPKVPHVSEDGTLPHFLPARRGRLLDALETLGEPDDDLVETRLWGHVIIDSEHCSGCSMCAVFCPTGALAKQAGNAGKALVHAPSLCVKCRSCEQVCPSHSLRLSEEVFAVDLLKGYVECMPLHDIAAEKGGPDAIRNSMAKLIDSPFLWG